MFFTIGGSVIAGLSRERERGEKRTFDMQFVFSFVGSAIGSASGLYRGIRETRDLTGSVRTSS